MQHYDFIIAGGGIAGLSLAYHLVQSPLRDRSILIVDKCAKTRNDRTLCFWANQPTLFDEITYRSWRQLQVVGDAFAMTTDLRDYHYSMIRGIDFYRFVQQALSAYPNVTLMQGVVNSIADGPDAACVTVGGQTFSGTWVFDSIVKPSELYIYEKGISPLRMYAKGWEIETARPAFDPQRATLMDFRTAQCAETRFFYVLPLSERRALVEFTAFSTDRFSHQDYEQALKAYLATTLGLEVYRILSEEIGMIPMLEGTFQHRKGRHVLTIGTKAGRVRPTTGYGFMRIQHDSAAMVRSLLRHGHPFAIPADAGYYRWLDRVMLKVIAGHGDAMKSIFSALFKHNPLRRILRFLDEAASPWEIVALVASLPPWLFVRMALGLEHRPDLPAAPEFAGAGDQA